MLLLSADSLSLSQDKAASHKWTELAHMCKRKGEAAVTKPLYGLIMSQVKSASHLDKETPAKWSKNYKDAGELQCKLRCLLHERLELALINSDCKIIALCST